MYLDVPILLESTIVDLCLSYKTEIDCFRGSRRETPPMPSILVMWLYSSSIIYNQIN